MQETTFLDFLKLITLNWHVIEVVKYLIARGIITLLIARKVERVLKSVSAEYVGFF